MSRPTRPRHVRERQPSGGAWERAEEFQSGEHLPGPPRTKPTACSPGRVPGDCGAAGLGREEYTASTSRDPSEQGCDTLTCIDRCETLGGPS